MATTSELQSLEITHESLQSMPSLANGRETSIASLVQGWGDVIHWRESRRNQMVENHHEIDHLLSLIISEIQEVIEAIEFTGSAFNLQDYLMEICDVFVVLQAFATRRNMEPDFARIISNVDGQATHSTVYEDLESRAMELPRIKNAQELIRKVEEIITILISLYQHAPGAIMLPSFSDTIVKVTEKNARNRPIKPHNFYQIGEDKEQQLLAYHHVEKSLKIMRKSLEKKLGYKVPLEPWMFTDAIVACIYDYQHSEKAREKLQQLVDVLLKKHLPNQVQKHLSSAETKPASSSGQLTEVQLLLAGAVPL